MPCIEFQSSTAAYPIHIGCGLLQRLGEQVCKAAPHARAVLMLDMALMQTHAATVLASLQDAGIQPVIIPLEAAEKEKSLDVVHRVYRGLIKSSHERHCPVIAMGGGVIGDLAGFVSATYLRGVPLIQVPTTLLAMVDASIGGKVGVNFPLPDGTLGKNLIGAFYQPKAVIADPEVLRTLSGRDFRCGLAECIKHAVIADAELLTFVEENVKAILGLEMAVLTSLIERCARIKVGIVQQDEREEGQRALLNLGHTFAHAIEPLPQLDLRHGEAVSIGMVAAMHCAVATKRMDHREAARVKQLLERVALPVRLPRAAALRPLIETMGFDKKVVDGKLRLVLPRGLGSAEIVDDVPMAMIESAWREVGAA